MTVLPEQSLNEGRAIDFVVRKEFDYAVKEFAEGKPVDEILGASYRKNGSIATMPTGRRSKTSILCRT